MVRKYEPDVTKCCRCSNKSFTGCLECKNSSNFNPECTYEEYKQKRKEETRRVKNGIK